MAQYKKKHAVLFGNNVGMVLGESAQFVILMEDSLAVDLGAKIYGTVASVSSHSDGLKVL